jgi:selenocysteine-specific elongation factor
VQVIATAGHVDHGKSTLVRALTGMEPDRWAEERRRGMTIDLGFAWTTLPSGAEVAFVDVPGHERFTSNMLAGVGPVPAALLVVAADGGWSPQTAEHVAALDALGVRHGVLAVTRSDLADPSPVVADSLERLAATSLGEVEAVAVSAPTGAGMDDLRAALGRLAAALPPPDGTARVRLWVDRSFTMRGFGTVVTGTLGAGRVAVGDTLELAGEDVVIRGIESLNRSVPAIGATSRVALNLRAVPRGQVRRGQALLTKGAWLLTETVDVRLSAGGPPGTPREAPAPPSVPHESAATAQTRQERLGRHEAPAPPPLEHEVAAPPAPEHVASVLSHAQPETAAPTRMPREAVLHLGSAAVPVGVRRLDDRHLRLQLATPLPLQVGDRALLRDPGLRQILAGVVVLDPSPPALGRRGAARARAGVLAGVGTTPSRAGEVERRQVVSADLLARLGVPAGPAPEGSVEAAGWLVAEARWEEWQEAVKGLVREHDARPDRLVRDGVSRAEVIESLGLPDAALLGPVVAGIEGLELVDGQVRDRRRGRVVDPALVSALQPILDRLSVAPFDAPPAVDLPAAGLDSRRLGAAAAAGLVLLLPGGIVLAPDAAARAVDVLSRLPQPFTTSEARQALATSRRVAVPLLEHLDRQSATRRLDDTHRTVTGRRP